MADAVRCDTCRWWVEFSPNWTHDVYCPWGVPGHEKINQETETMWGTCERESAADPPMFTVDGSNYFSALRTRRTFWCSAWEEADHG